MRGELRNVTRSHGDRLGDASLLVKQIRNGRSHVGETLHGRSVRLQKDAAREPMLLDKRSIGLGAPVADEHELSLPFSKPLLEAGEVRCDLPAIPAVRAPVDEQHAFSPELL